MTQPDDIVVINAFLLEGCLIAQVVQEYVCLLGGRAPEELVEVVYDPLQHRYLRLLLVSDLQALDRVRAVRN